MIDGRLEVVSLSDHEWRVCDGRKDQHDATRVLGFVEKREGQYQLMRLSMPGRYEPCAGLTEALTALSGQLCPR